MFVSIIVRLRPARDYVLPQHLGRAVHSATLARIGAHSPALAQELHDVDGIKPLTCSGLFGHKGGAIRTDSIYSIRLTGFSTDVSAVLQQLFVDAPPPSMDLHGLTFIVLDTICDPARHPWSGATTDQHLASRHMVSRRTPSPTTRMLFQSPTAFRSGRFFVPVPMPDLFFGSLIDRWNAFSSIQLEPALREAVKTGVGISALHLQSVPVQGKGKAVQIGSIGKVSYRALNLDRYQLAVMHLLADFALYSGVGIKTTTGMGQVRRD